MLEEKQIDDYDLEKIILGTFILDEKNYISSTILEPKHFLDKRNRNIFIFLVDFYKKNHTLNISQLMLGITDVFQRQVIFEYFSNVDITDKHYFEQNQKKLILKWKKFATKELLTKYNNEEIDYATLKIKLEEINMNQFFKNILNISDDVKDFGNVSKERELTKIQRLDYLLKGLEYGYIYLWTGVTNAGKTTLMIQVAKELLKEGRKIFYFSGEQTAQEFKNYLFVSMCSKEQISYIKDPHNSDIIDIVPNDSMLNYLNDLLRDKLYLYNNEIPKNDIETMILVMEEAYKLGIRIFFIDNFMQLDNSELLEQQTKIMEKFKRYALTKNVIINLVAHPRKTQFSSSRLNIMDISGTQNIANKASSIITITRVDSLNEHDYDYAKTCLGQNGYSIDSCNAFIEVLKTKGNGNGLVGLVYDKELKIYREARKMTHEEHDNFINSKSGKKGRN